MKRVEKLSAETKRRDKRLRAKEQSPDLADRIKIWITKQPDGENTIGICVDSCPAPSSSAGAPPILRNTSILHLTTY